MPPLYLRDCSLGGVPPRADTEPALEDLRAGSVSLRHTFIQGNLRPYVCVGVKLRMPDLPPEPHQSTPAASGVSCRGAVPPSSTGTPDIQGPPDATATVSATAPSIVQPAAGSGNGAPVVLTIDPSPAPSQPGTCRLGSPQGLLVLYSSRGPCPTRLYSSRHQPYYLVLGW